MGMVIFERRSDNIKGKATGNKNFIDIYTKRLDKAITRSICSLFEVSLLILLYIILFLCCVDGNE